MKVVALKIKGEKKNVYFMQEAFFKKDHGILGDAHAKGGDRQVSILSMKSRKKLDQEKLNGLCVVKFHENIIIDGLEVDELSLDDKLRIGDVVIKITSLGKTCYNECPLYQSGEKCPLVMDTIFGKVIASGIVLLEDVVTPLR